MGGLGPGIGGLEILVIGLLALIVVGPKDLPLLLRKVGRAVGKARAMAGEFRSSFDEMARQAELDELRKEVEALRTGQGLVPLGAEAEATFKDISKDLNRPLESSVSAEPGHDEWPDNPPAMTSLPAPVDAPAAKSTPKTPRKPRAKAGEETKAEASVPSRPAKGPASAGSSTKTTKRVASTRKPSTGRKAADL